MSSTFERKFLEKLGDSWEGATPGFVAQAYSKGRKILDVEVGKTYERYDLASMTKILFTVTALMALYDEKRFRLSDPVHRWVSWFPEDHPARIRDLLTHSAGLTWWYPFFKTLAPKTVNVKSPEEAWDIFQGILKRKILSDLDKNPVQWPIEKSIYSDLDFFVLGSALESITGSTLYTAWANLQDRLELTGVDFNRNNKPKYARSTYAPTEKDAWRGKTLQGEVHDENTWALRGVAPHAGLFGGISDVTGYGLMLRSAMRGSGSSIFPSASTVAKFTKRALPRARGDWALGFVMPSKGSSTAGPHFSLKSVGHTGFTGTSLWYDPKKDLLVTILSNRVHPTRDNTAFQKLRPQIHSWISEELD
jgi:CubicO group peptidase (beta-lactamase class C family)